MCSLYPSLCPSLPVFCDVSSTVQLPPPPSPRATVEKLQKDLDTKRAESEGLAATLHSLETAASEATSEKEKLKILVDRSSEDMERVLQVGGRGGRRSLFGCEKTEGVWDEEIGLRKGVFELAREQNG